MKGTQRHRNREHDNEFKDLPPLPGNPVILPRDEHNISRKDIDADCLKVMSRLLRHGHRAFLVGGGVRDLLLGKQPQDFDIGTDASPEQVRSLFRNSRIIGRRFRINHIYFTGGKIFEVSTFRATGEDDPARVDGMPLKSDNTYGDPQSDALRRDLTINGLFYDLSTFSIIDYVGGIADLRAGIIRIIGVPEARIKEDPVRMIRAIRHSARTGFTIEEKTYNAICEGRQLIKNSAQARVFEELLRELQGGCARESLRLISQTGLLPYLLPALSHQLEAGGAKAACTLELTLSKIDAARAKGEEISQAVLFAALFIGNFPMSVVEDELGEEAKEDVRAFWSLDPFSPGSDAPVQGSSTSSRKIRVSALAKAVELLFRPLGVPRKERERVPQMVAARYMLIALYQDGGDQRAILERSYFQEAMQLLRITAHDDLLNECVEYWTSRSKDRVGGAPRRRRRNRSRRRRGGGDRGAARHVP